jgi:hypothetical protein
MTNNIDISDYIKDIKTDRYNCIYLIYLSTIGQAGKSVYKFGRTYDPLNRFHQYPKNSTLIYLVRVKDCFYVEDQIYKLFLTYFIQKTEYGREYFETSDVKQMIGYMDKLIDHMHQRLDDEMVELIKPSYKKWLKFKVYDLDQIPDNFSNNLINGYSDDKTDYTDKSNKYKCIFKQKNIKKEYEDKNIFEDVDENQINKILYDPSKNFTNKECTILDIFKHRAEYLGIDYNKKIQKKKVCELISDTDKFTKYYIYKLLTSDNEIDADINELKSKYHIKNAKNLIEKIRLIKNIEKVLDVKILEINTDNYIERFEEDIEVDADIQLTVKRLFRSIRQMDNNYRCWYYQLVQIYKNILDNNIFNIQYVRRNGKRCYLYTLNNNIIKAYR